MSRVGKRPVAIPSGVKVKLAGRQFSAQGPKGKLERTLPDSVNIAVEGETVVVTPLEESRRARAMHGLARTLIDNMVVGVSTGFQRGLEVIGVGYRVELKKNFLMFNLGYSHPIWYELPEGLTAEVDKNNNITLKGSNKETLGQAAATIRSFRPPEPYKGKGIRYAGEVIKTKVGKAGAA